MRERITCPIHVAQADPAADQRQFRVNHVTALRYTRSKIEHGQGES